MGTFSDSRLAIGSTSVVVTRTAAESDIEAISFSSAGHLTLKKSAKKQPNISPKSSAATWNKTEWEDRKMRVTIRPYPSPFFPWEAKTKGYSNVFVSVEAAKKAMEARFGPCEFVIPQKHIN